MMMGNNPYDPAISNNHCSPAESLKNQPKKIKFNFTLKGVE